MEQVMSPYFCGRRLRTETTWRFAKLLKFFMPVDTIVLQKSDGHQNQILNAPFYILKGYIYRCLLLSNYHRGPRNMIYVTTTYLESRSEVDCWVLDWSVGGQHITTWHGQVVAASHEVMSHGYYVGTRWWPRGYHRKIKAIIFPTLLLSGFSQSQYRYLIKLKSQHGLKYYSWKGFIHKYFNFSSSYQFHWYNYKLYHWRKILG